MANTSPTYKYKESESIILGVEDQYDFSVKEYYQLYSFFVTYSLCGSQSKKKRTLTDYGWEYTSFSKSNLQKKLEDVLALNGNENFCFNPDDLKTSFARHDLQDGKIENLDEERGVLVQTSDTNKYLKLFYRIRDGLAHGSFSLRKNCNDEKMIVIQDQDRNNVTARIVIRLNTLLEWIRIIDKKCLIVPKKQEHLEQMNVNEQVTEPKSA